MRVLWISCLLIGSITCSPVGKGYGSNSAATSFMQQPSSSGYWYSGTGGSADSGSSSSLPSLPNPSSEFSPGVSSSSPDVYSSSNMAEGQAFHHGYPTFRDEGYYGGYGSYGSVSAPRDEDWSSGPATSYGATDENPEPVFSDVSDLEPVYAFSSRSSYQRGRALFAQTRYTPEEPVFPPMPVSRPISKTPSHQSHPAKAPTKGGF